MSKEIPILFSTPMVQAILDNRKTMTRNVANDQDVKRMLSLAITEAQASQMWAVKAVTW